MSVWSRPAVAGHQLAVHHRDLELGEFDPETSAVAARVVTDGLAADAIAAWRSAEPRPGEPATWDHRRGDLPSEGIDR